VNSKALWFALVSSVMLAAACNERPQLLAPDQEIDFSCPGAPSEPSIESFLRRNGFVAFNEERARRKRQREYFPLQIDGFSRKRRTLNAIGLQEPQSRGHRVNYKLMLTSPPPTAHDAVLEAAAAKFVHDTLHCHIRSTKTNDNGRESLALFNRFFADEQRRIAKWRNCNAPRGRLDSVCPR
jgi:hypothetical protein